MNEDESPLVNGNDCSPTQTYNGKHRKHARLSLENIQTRTTVDQSTSTIDLSKNLRDQSTSTEDLSADFRGTNEDVRECDDDSEDKTNCKGVSDGKSRLQSQDRRELFKTKSSPSLMEGKKAFSKVPHFSASDFLKKILTIPNTARQMQIIN
jgi:hypothetical protein